MLDLEPIKKRADSVAAIREGTEPTLEQMHSARWAARMDVPALIAEVEQLRAQVEAVRELHRRWQVTDCDCDYHTNESECSGEVMYTVCRECCTSNGYHSEECANEHVHGPTHPICPTVEALGEVQ